MCLVKGHTTRSGGELLFDFVFATAIATPHGFDKFVIVKGLFHLVERVADLDVRVQELVRLLEHVLLDVVKKRRDLARKSGDLHGKLVVSVAASNHDLTVFDVARSDFKTYGDTLHLPFVELPAGRLLSVVKLHSDALGAERGCDFACLVENAFFVRRNGNDHHLHGSDSRGKFEPALIAVRHDERADKTCGHAPACLIRIFELTVFVEIFDLKRGREVLSEIVRSAGLQGFAVKHHGFHRVGVNRACEFLFFGLLTDKNVDCKHVLHKLAIHFEHAESLFSRLFFGLVQSVTFLPQELACAKEGTSGLFPSYDVCPLVDEHGQVAIALDPLCVHGANDGLGSWAHDKLLFERSVANM